MLWVQVPTTEALRQADMQSAGMNQPTARQLHSLRFSALARDDRAVAELRALISNSPDDLVEELMNRHGWAAHEAVCAVQQVQEEALQDITGEAAA